MLILYIQMHFQKLDLYKNVVSSAVLYIHVHMYMFM